MQEDWSGYALPLIAVFCINHSYNRRNLYLCVSLIVRFCTAEKVDIRKEILFGSSDPNVSRMIRRIYTTNLIDSLEHIVRRNLMEILAYRYPDALISHRSAKERGISGAKDKNQNRKPRR